MPKSADNRNTLLLRVELLDIKPLIWLFGDDDPGRLTTTILAG